jgi:hypothetical protein
LGLSFGPKLVTNARILLTFRILINKCWNIGPKGLQIGFPNWMVSFLLFFSLGGKYKAIIKVQHLLLVSSLGQIEKYFEIFFSISALAPSV